MLEHTHPLLTLRLPIGTAGLAGAPSLRRCSFDVGAPRLQAAAAGFVAAFAQRTSAPD